MATELREILLQPIPDQTYYRRIKSGYRDYPLLTAGSRDAEPLVDIALYGIAGQSYYSRPNDATGEPVDGVRPEILVRQGIAEKLAEINFALQQSPVIDELFKGKVELYIEEGFRSTDLQAKLYNEVFPRLIHAQSPQLSKSNVAKRRDELSAKPPQPGDSPSPHATGAALDLTLRYVHAELGYKPAQAVDMGHHNADTSHVAEPDYFESQQKLDAGDRAGRRNRRILYWTMRGALIGDDMGFVVNPTEWWHWSYGDQMWAQLQQAPEAFYAYAVPQ